MGVFQWVLACAVLMLAAYHQFHSQKGLERFFRGGGAAVLILAGLRSCCCLTGSVRTRKALKAPKCYCVWIQVSLCKLLFKEPLIRACVQVYEAKRHFITLIKHVFKVNVGTGVI